MEKHMENKSFQQDIPGVRYVVLVTFLGILAVAVLVFLLANTMWLNQRLQENTKSYASDTSSQLSSNISTRFQLREIYIRNLADTFAGMPRSLLTEELLDRKAEYLDMEEIFLVNADGTVYPSDTRYAGLEEYLAEHPDVYRTPHIFFTGHEEVFFSSPVFWKDSSEPSLLIGVRTSTVLQQMLQDVDFKDQGLCCIIDKTGTVIVSPTDETPFLKLNEIFSKNQSRKDVNALQQVFEDIAEQRSGLVEFEDIGGEPMMLGYDFLGINDWMLLTLFPSDLMSAGTEVYLAGYISIFGIMALIMLLIFFYILWMHRRSLAQIQDIAFTDHLTGGKNELALWIEGDRLLHGHPQQSYAILYLNIRNFKWLNERFGVKAGDEILRQFHAVLQGCLQKDEILSRIAGDHFCLLLKCSSEEDVRQRLHPMLDRLDERLCAQYIINYTHIARGAYLIQEKEEEFIVLSDRAKIASTYQLEDEVCHFYDRYLEDQLKREKVLDASFKSAIQNHEFRLYIQPKVSTDTKQISGGEVLVRWQHPEYGLILPGDFVPHFERNGKICELDYYMFEETCKLLKSWLAEGRAIPLSVNLSRAHLTSSDVSFLDRFHAIKDAYQIPDGLIELELMESMMVERREVSLVAAIVDRIRSMGILCSIDDFGFGYSSLTMMKDLNVDMIKMDRQFFLNENEKSWGVISHLIQMAHSFGIAVVAEGIEGQEQVDKLRQCGCDLVQGYVFAKPMIVSEFQKFLVL